MADDVRTSTGELYPLIEPFNRGNLDVGDGHTLYWEECGNPDGPAVVFLHGGPGAGCAPSHRRLFDPGHWRIVLFDQRGCGLSKPTAGIEANTTQHVIADMEAIRSHLNINDWLVFGGSWGSLLAVAYGIAHSDRCTGFVIRGVFLGEREELRWFVEDMGRFFPNAKRKFVEALPSGERDDIMGNYHKRLIDPDPTIHQPAADAWSNFESACARLIPSGNSDTGGSLSLSRIEAHYFVNDMFLAPRYILDNVAKIAHLPCVMVQGRYDVICPPWTADSLSRAWPGSELVMVNDAGHSAFEPGIRKALVKATDQMRQINQ
ncbi:MAG: prolyl aminopeptidase [Rhodospirillales bacterium]|jgi:proline iminopeptidase|nr:prolyl aminopeptidase [Rhodospirillales bacterium]MBT4040104.1 prolyl aminopeptidase [Rhodospirillales bacterium]MBT4627844.1 prolyl aminopeptidase [Rhodospirillales bacterium]MBT5351384.1 prolyl aminopeptidase [Rhodospirillales bacterium]MBT5522233.1 prolyl aminopeptidase [Rhodospirillales bacterium]